MSRSSRTDAEVLFLGLEGSGKTLLARRLQSLLGEAGSARGERFGAATTGGGPSSAAPQMGWGEGVAF